MRTALFLALLAACDKPSSSTTDASTSGNKDASTTPDTSTPSGAATDAAIDALPQNCPTGQLCFYINKVVPTATIPNGRIVVMFYQFNDDVDPYPTLVSTLDKPFVGASTMVQVPLGDIGKPTPLDDYELCPRTCLDLNNPACDCPANQPRVALAFVLAMVDPNMSGMIEPAELDEDNMYGVGYMSIGTAPMAYPNAAPLQSLFPNGIVSGVAPYEIIEAGTFDKLGVPPPGAVFLMDVCVPGDASCNQMRFPNLT
jgi:hypothetical protein